MHKIAVIRNELSEVVLDRDEMIDGLFMGILTGHHVLFLGPPGTAKSMLVNEFGSRLAGGRKFTYLMNKFTKPDEIIGSVSLQGLEKDEYRRILTGKIADAHFVFLDEVFHSNSSCANAILTILNERRYHNGTEVVPVPLIMMVGAANELPSETADELGAFFDRFLFRYSVDYIQAVDSLQRLFHLTGRSGNITTYDLEELHQWQAEAAQVEVPADITGRVINIVLKLREAGVPVSDRRFRESKKVLQAHAYLRGRSKVVIEDLAALKHIFWFRPEDKKTFKDVLFTAKMTFETQSADLLKEALQIKQKFDSLDDRARQQILGGAMNSRLTEITQRINELRELAAVPSSVITDAARRVEEIHTGIIQTCLSLNATSPR